MYKWYSYFIFSFLLLLSIGVAITLFYVKPSDRSYLLELTKKKEEAGLNTHYEGEQLRKQVVKDIWFLPLGKSQRLHFQIKRVFNAVHHV